MRLRLFGCASIKKWRRNNFTVTSCHAASWLYDVLRTNRAGVSDKIDLFKRAIKPPLINLRAF